MPSVVAATPTLEVVRQLWPWISCPETYLESEQKGARVLPPQPSMMAHEQALGNAWLKVDLATLIPYQRSSGEASASVTAEIESAINVLILKRISIPRPAEVRDYLLRYPDMIDLLPYVCGIASERLGPDTQLSLEAYRGPEIRDEYLTLYVRQRDYDQSILDSIEEVSAECEGELAGRSGWILITTDFRAPSKKQ